MLVQYSYSNNIDIYTLLPDLTYHKRKPKILLTVSCLTYNHAVKTNRREVKLMLKRILIKRVILFCAHVIKAFGTFFKMLQISVQNEKRKLCIPFQYSYSNLVSIYTFKFLSWCYRHLHACMNRKLCSRGSWELWFNCEKVWI